MVCFATSTFSQNINPDYYDGTVYLKIKEDCNLKLPAIGIDTKRETYPYFGDIILKYGIYELYRPFTKIKSAIFENTYQLNFGQDAQVEDLIKELGAKPEVEYVEKVPIMKSFYTPNDPYANDDDQWFLEKIKAYKAWDIHTSGSEVVVAIVDDAVRWDHEDLEDNLWVNEAEYFGSEFVDDDGNGYVDDIIGWDAANLDNNPAPPSAATNSEFSHGTHCAGIAAGATDNSTGIASISINNAKIMSCKGKFDSSTGNNIEQVWAAFEYAAVNAPDIISCSWGGGGFSTTLQNLVNFAANNGSIVIAAAGNDNTSLQAYPAAYNNVIAVANTDQSDTRNPNSNYGAWVDISAPGTGIFSSVATTTGTYETYNGTSMACPMVAGLVALMKSFQPSASNSELVNCLLFSADNIDGQNPSFQGLLGAGRINAEQALECLGGSGNGCEENLVTLTLTLDNYGSETTWGIYEGNSLLAAGGPYVNNAGGQVITENLCLDDGCYDLVMFDEFSDGMCCDYGNGAYHLQDENENTLALGGEFGAEEATTFCLNGDGGGNPCPSPAGFSLLEAGYAHFHFVWDAAPEAEEYQTRSRPAGTSNWTEGGWYPSLGIYWGNMSPCTQYEIQVRAMCGGVEGSFSPSFYATTLGCNEEYCYSYGLTWDDWIQQVQFADMDNISGKDYGYADFTSHVANVQPGSSYPISLKAATDDNIETVYWRVWIDVNQDGDFDDGDEMVFQASGTNTQTVNGSVAITNAALLGPTRMRVSMSLGGYSGPCETGDYREVEDYALAVGQNASLTLSPEMAVVPATATSASFTANSSVGWSIGTVTAGWLNASASGNAVNLSFAQNTSSNSRVAQVTVTTNAGNLSETFTLTQEGAPPPPQLSISPASQTVGSAADCTNFQVNSNTNWNISDNANWVTSVAPQSGNGPANVTVCFAANTGTAQRQTSLSITAGGLVQTFSLTQEGASPPAPFLNASTDLITLGPNEQTAIFGITSNTDWVINVASASNWLGAISPQFGEEDATIFVPCQENTSPQQRVALLEITPVGTASLTVTIVQEGALINSVGEKGAGRTQVIVYPNPAADILHLTFATGSAAPAAVRLFDSQGRMVKTWTGLPVANGSPCKLDVSDLPSGVYLAHIRQAGVLFVEKIRVAR